MRKLLVGVVVLVPGLAVADDAKPAAKDPKAQAPAAPPEVKATVDAFKGNWTFDASVTATGADKPTKFKITFNCKPIAGGNAVSCDGKARTSQGPWQATYLAGYDPYAKAVRFIGVTNNFEINDHRCQWHGTTLECAALKGGSGATGEEVTTEMKLVFDKRTCTFTSTTTAKSGAKTVFEGKGKK